MPRYAELIYNGFWFAPEREMLQALIDKSQEHVEGEVRLKLYKGNVIVTGRESPKSLYSSTLVTFEDDKGAYDQKDAEGFIRLNALACARWPCATKAAGQLASKRTMFSPHRDRPHRRHRDLSRHDVRAGAAALHLPLLHQRQHAGDVGRLHHRRRPAAVDPAARAGPRLRRPPVQRARLAHRPDRHRRRRPLRALAAGLGVRAHRSSIWRGRR